MRNSNPPIFLVFPLLMMMFALNNMFPEQSTQVVAVSPPVVVKKQQQIATSLWPKDGQAMKIPSEKYLDETKALLSQYKGSLDSSSIIPYDNLAWTPLGERCSESRSGRHVLVGLLRTGDAIVVYHRPEKADLFTGVYPPTTASYKNIVPVSDGMILAGDPKWFETPNFGPCNEGLILVLPLSRHQTETAEYYWGKGKRT